MSVLAIDPGKSNMGVWLGDVSESEDGKLSQRTVYLGKEDMGNVPLYEGTVEVLSKLPFIKSGTFSAVVETQDPRNIPARVVAMTAYGYLRGLGVDCEFSSSRLKNGAIDRVAADHSVELVAKPPVEKGADKKLRRRQLHDINKKNSKLAVLAMLKDCGEVDLCQKITSARDPGGRLKADDMTDAILLGIGLWIKKNPRQAKKRTARTSKVKVT